MSKRVNEKSRGNVSTRISLLTNRGVDEISICTHSLGVVERCLSREGPLREFMVSSSGGHALVVQGALVVFGGMVVEAGVSRCEGECRGKCTDGGDDGHRRLHG